MQKRILLGKVGLDGHTVGIQIVAKAFRDAGFEVIFAGMALRPAQMVEIALQEDADIIGISMLSGAHMEVITRILDMMKEKGLDKTPLILGGVVPPDDVRLLKEKGLAEFFGPNSTTVEIVEKAKALI